MVSKAGSCQAGGIGRRCWVFEKPMEDHLTYTEAINRLTEAQAAYASINSVHDLITHPQLRTRRMDVHGRAVEVPATPYIIEWDDSSFRRRQPSASPTRAARRHRSARWSAVNAGSGAGTVPDRRGRGRKLPMK